MGSLLELSLGVLLSDSREVYHRVPATVWPERVPASVVRLEAKLSDVLFGNVTLIRENIKIDCFSINYQSLARVYQIRNLLIYEQFYAFQPLTDRYSFSGIVIREDRLEFRHGSGSVYELTRIGKCGANSGRLPNIYYTKLEKNALVAAPVIGSARYGCTVNSVVRDNIERKPSPSSMNRSHCRLCANDGGFRGGIVKAKTCKESQSADGSQRYLKPRNDYNLLSRFRHRFLSGEVPALTFCGLISAYLGALCLNRVFDNPDRKRKVILAACAISGLALCGFFYGWAVSGRIDGILCFCFAENG